MRILGITISDNKQLQYALTAIYGIGHSGAKKILNKAKVSHELKSKDASEKQEADIRNAIEGMVLEGDLKRSVSQNIKRLKDIQSYRGMRHSRNLPTKGQRTKTNSRTVRGNKRNTMGSGRRKLEKT